MKVEQGYVASTLENNGFSKAVIVHFNSKSNTLRTLIEIHLLTHHNSSDHSMRKKYHSAVYTFDDLQSSDVNVILSDFQEDYKGKLITRILPFRNFETSRKAITNYYYNNPQIPFCATSINPKLRLLLNQFSRFVDHERLEDL